MKFVSGKLYKINEKSGSGVESFQNGFWLEKMPDRRVTTLFKNGDILMHVSMKLEKDRGVCNIFLGCDGNLYALNFYGQSSWDLFFEEA